jgi:hypothetical protein
MNWRQEYQSKCREAGQGLKAVRVGVVTPRADAPIVISDPQIQKEPESFAVRSHSLERTAAVCARGLAAAEEESE